MSEHERTADRAQRPKDFIPTAVESWQRHMRIRQLIEQARRTRRRRASPAATQRDER